MQNVSRIKELEFKRSEVSIADECNLHASRRPSGGDRAHAPLHGRVGERSRKGKWGWETGAVGQGWGSQGLLAT